MFELLEDFKKKTRITDLKLCTVLMEDKEYPWIILIPMRENVQQIHELSKEDGFQLMEEIRAASQIMNKLFSPDRLNIAAIGNKTPQLHIHIVARNTTDPLWPETVWGQKMKKLSMVEIEKRERSLKQEFQNVLI